MTVPTALVAVPQALLDALAAMAPAPASRAAPPAGPRDGGSTGTYTARLLVERWLADRGVAYRVKPDRDDKGRTVYVLAHCPFDAGHADPDACVMQAENGQLSAQCFHNSCRGRGWQEFKDALGAPGPNHYDPPLGRKSRRPRRPGAEGRRIDPAAAVPTAEPATVAEGPQAEVSQPAPHSGRSGGRTVVIHPAEIPLADTLAALTDALLTAGDCYCRAGQLVRIADATITPVLAPAELAGLLNLSTEVVVVGQRGEEFRPLPTAYGATWLNHARELGRLPPLALFTLNPVYTPDWRLSPPGYDPASGIYYAGPAIEPRAGTARLDELLAEFCFRTPGDRTNYLGMLLTAILMPHFVGSKPAVLFGGNQPGLGKTILSQVIAVLRDGRPAETASYNPNDEEFEKRLGAIVRRGATTIIVDNAKGKGRQARIDSPCLERSITDEVLSFRLLGQSREIRAENSHVFCLTANTPDVSRDLVTRCVLVDLFHEGDPARRTFAIPDPEGYAREHRHALLGELAGMVERWRAAGAPEAQVHTRFNKKGWGRIVGGILAAASRPDFLANAETAAAELDDLRREFAHLVGVLADHPQGVWTAGELTELVGKEALFPTEFKGLSPRAVATRLGVLAGRYVGMRFPLGRDRWCVFHRTETRKGNVYHVDVQGGEDME